MCLYEQQDPMESDEAQHPCDACWRPVGVTGLVSESDREPTDGSPRGGLCEDCDRQRRELGKVTYLCQTCHQPLDHDEDLPDLHCTRGMCLNYRGEA